MSLSVAIPDTSLSESSDLRQKTIKAGRIGRALAVFRVEQVIVYDSGLLDKSMPQDANLLTKILRYLDTPQYLRRRVFSRSSSLKFAGLLPPLRTQSHPLAGRISDLVEGDVRWGIQLRSGKVDLGFDRPLDYKEKVSEREPSLFQVTNAAPNLRLKEIDRSDAPRYFGFEVSRESNLVRWLKDMAGTTRVGFSRNATEYDRLESDLKTTVTGTLSVLAVFGGPNHGVQEVIKSGDGSPSECIDFWLNAIPGQGTETVRLDEALLAGLGLLNHSVGRLVARPGFYE
jgi:predicted SPOUT superfamily RNA methylase MTH1